MRKKIRFPTPRVSVIPVPSMLAQSPEHRQVVAVSYDKQQRESGTMCPARLEAPRGVGYDPPGRRLVWKTESDVKTAPSITTTGRANGIHKELVQPSHRQSQVIEPFVSVIVRRNISNDVATPRRRIATR